MSAEGVTDELRMRYIDDWFSGEALKLVQSKKNNSVLVDATTTLRSIRDVLDFKFKEEKEFDVREILKNVVKGNPIAKGDVKSTESFITELQCQFDVAEGKGEEAIFGKKSTYVDIVNAKFPYLIQKWTWLFVTFKREVNFRAFITFVREEARFEEEFGSTFQSEDRDPREVATPVRSRSDSGLEEEFSKEDSVARQGRTTNVCGCPLCGDAHLLMRCRKFLSKVPIQRWRVCKREKLCLRCLGKNHISKHCHHTSCLECGGAHHSLLHDHGTHQSSRATCSRPTRRAEERHVRRDDNSDGVSGTKAQRPSREARSRKWYWAGPGGAPY